MESIEAAGAEREVRCWREPEPASLLPVDTVHLARYTLGDAALEREVLELFTAETPRRIEALRQAHTDRDWKVAAHTLKGSGRAIGAWALARAAQQAEHIGGIADRTACEAAIQAIESAAREAESFITRLYPPLPA